MPLRKRLPAGHPASRGATAGRNNHRSDRASDVQAPSKPSVGARARDRCGALSIKMALATKSLPSKLKARASSAAAALRATDWGLITMPHPNITGRMPAAQSGSSTDNGSHQQSHSTNTPRGTIVAVLAVNPDGSSSGASGSSPQASPRSPRDTTTCSSPPSSPATPTSSTGAGTMTSRGTQYEANQCLSIGPVMVVETTTPSEVTEAETQHEASQCLAMSDIMLVESTTPEDVLDMEMEYEDDQFLSLSTIMIVDSTSPEDAADETAQIEASQCLSISEIAVVESTSPEDDTDAAIPLTPELSMSGIMVAIDCALKSEDTPHVSHDIINGAATKAAAMSPCPIVRLPPNPAVGFLAYDSDSDSEHSQQSWEFVAVDGAATEDAAMSSRPIVRLPPRHDLGGLGSDSDADSESSCQSSEFVADPQEAVYSQRGPYNEVAGQDDPRDDVSGEDDGMDGYSSDRDSDEEFPAVSQEVLNRLMGEGMDMLGNKSGPLPGSKEDAAPQLDAYFAERDQTDLRPCYAKALLRKNWARFPDEVAKTPFCPRPKKEWKKYQVSWDNWISTGRLPFSGRMKERFPGDAWDSDSDDE
ncbi:hypothetical protein GGTG_09165 [Gaeumannomyces tritici R3-111a-1]|uniref:Uncharacterized protein n=1 Tax=Gaeumannomyces tritici (strain R3-111a-1) TaxID=644352 RepID=J3P6M3_GAET3|nr:hypothetical protein GGTG_09165 [Gaeumannomyces tritici R3-111a-1]EJT72299.1 hypothetical protein GGTG_09165 [Gaeumannomyces tritici R3-111a-1]